MSKPLNAPSSGADHALVFLTQKKSRFSGIFDIALALFADRAHIG